MFAISLRGRWWLLWERELECKRRRNFSILNSINISGNITPLCYSVTNGLVHAITTRGLTYVKPLTPNDHYSGRTAPLTSKVTFYIFIQQIYVLNILNMTYTVRFFPLQNAVCFIILTYLVPVLFTFYILIQQI